MQETQETWVQSLGQEEPLEEGMATHSNILPMDTGARQASVHGVSKSWTGLSDYHTHTHILLNPFLGEAWCFNQKPQQKHLLFHLKETFL